MSKVYISIITVSLNAANQIKETLESIVYQSYPYVELLIIDGGSVDGTINIIEKYIDRVDYFVSEPDEGIYNAMNKGIKASTGDVLYFLNADDCFCDTDVLLDVAEEFNADPDLDWVYGNVLLEEQKLTTRVQYSRQLTRKTLLQCGFNHQALFARRETFEWTGGFDEQYKVAADGDWILKNLSHGVKTRQICRDIARFRLGGFSGTANWRQEKVIIRKKHYSFLEYIYWRKFQMMFKKKNKGEPIKTS